MTEDQRSIAYRNEKRMLQTGGKYSAGFARYDYALRNYKDVYTGVQEVLVMYAILTGKNSMRKSV